MRRLLVEVLEDRRLLTFAPAVDYSVAPNPQDLVAGDFNNDTLQDLAVATEATGSVNVLLANPDGTFQPPLSSPIGASPMSLAVGDFNEDGKLDLAAANPYDLRVVLGNGAGSFGAPISMSVAGSPDSVAVGDFNGDGKLDLGVTSNFTYQEEYGSYSEGYADVLLGHADGTFSAARSTYLGLGYHYTALASDLNGDAYDDFVTSNGYVNVLLGSSSGNLQWSTDLYTYDESFSVAAADLDGDGDNDLLTANYYGSSVGVFLNDGAGGFSGPVNYPTGDYPSSLAVGDFTGDGYVDVLATYYYYQVSLLYGDGGGALSAPVHFAVDFNPWVVAAGDFNGDGRLDAATASNSENSVSVLINDGAFPPATLSIDDVTVTEGNNGRVAAVFTVTRGGDLSGAATVNYSTADGGALAGSDYVASSGALTFGPGETTQTITVLVNGDRLVESSESYVVELSDATNATIAQNSGLGTILDDEPRISISDETKKEGKKGQTTIFTFTVTLSAAYDEPVTMSFRTVNSTATTSDNDYVAKTGTLTFAPGETTKTITISVKGDSKREANEMFYLNLFDLSSNALFTKNRGIGTILNDD